MGAHGSQPSDLGTGEKTLGVYAAGIVACLALTFLPFGLVMHPILSHATTVGLVATCALAQFVIQVICFLRLNYHTEQARTNVQSFALTLLILLILIVATLWIMTSLHMRMMMH